MLRGQVYFCYIPQHCAIPSQLYGKLAESAWYIMNSYPDSFYKLKIVLLNFFLHATKLLSRIF